MNAQELYIACNECVGLRYPTGMCAIPGPAPVDGCGFFPVASGAFHDGSVTEKIRRKLLFVGQDWGCKNDLKALKTKKDADIQSGTGLKLYNLLKHAGIPLEECFFTNALFGVRTSHTNTGRSPGWNDKGFCQRCKLALNIQIRVIQPKAVVCLGRDAPRLVVEIATQCRPWNLAKNFGEIHINECAMIKLRPAEHGLSAAAILVHPSYRHINAERRSFGGKNGHDAEVELLQKLWNHVKES